MTREEKVPPLRAVYLYLTSACNLRCVHCWVQAESHPSWHDALSAREIVHVLEPARSLGLEYVKITGGEPFLRSDALEVIQALTREGLDVDVETNATLVTEEVARTLGTLGMCSVAVSLDGASPATHDAMRGQRGAFAAAMAAVGRLVHHGVSVEVLFTLTRKSAPELEELLNVCARLGVQAFKMNILLPMGRGLALYERDEALPVGEAVALSRRLTEDWAPSYPFAVATSLPLAFVSRDLLRRGEGHRCPILTILGLLHDGRVSFCGAGYLAEELCAGNLRKEGIDRLWRQSALFATLRAGLPSRLHGICGRCLMRSVCLGACRANAYMQTKDLFAGYWFCEAAARAGLFPESRLERACDTEADTATGR